MVKKSSDASINPTQLKPTDCYAALVGMIPTKRSPFMWGQPGISKSAIAKLIANDKGWAFIDIRLSQMDPTDLRGIPYPVVEYGQHGIRWSPPLVMPRNLGIESVQLIPAIASVIQFFNPTGDNGIHYCTSPKVSVQALDTGLTAYIITDEDETGRREVTLGAGQPLDRVRVVLRDASGKAVEGQVQYRVSGATKAVLALEEFNSAPPSVQAAAYQLILDRRLGEYEVPDGVFMLAMGNRDTDKGVTFKMPTPIMNRFIHIEMRVDAEDWINWALLHQVHPEVVGFISAFHEKLNQFNPGSAARGFPTPRSWEFVSDILRYNHGAGEIVLGALVMGAIGDGVGAEFMQFRKIAADLPPPEEVLSGRLKRMPREVDTSLSYALTTTLCYRLKEKSDELKRQYGTDPNSGFKRQKEYMPWLEECDNFLKFIIDNFKPEIAIMGAKAAFAVHQLPMDTQKMKHFETFADRFKGLIMH